jgi:hypothetical protein
MKKLGMNIEVGKKYKNSLGYLFVKISKIVALDLKMLAVWLIGE